MHAPRKAGKFHSRKALPPPRYQRLENTYALGNQMARRLIGGNCRCSQSIQNGTQNKGETKPAFLVKAPRNL